MLELMKVCPKCKGCGKVKNRRARTKAPPNDDPTKRWCYLCKVFLNLDSFYKNTWCCKSCHNSKNRLLRKYDLTCAFCSVKFLGFRNNQRCCGQSCKMKLRYRTLYLKKYGDLPHDCIEIMEDQKKGVY